MKLNEGAEDDCDACFEELKKRVQDYLATPDGWREMCDTSGDFNWGDFIQDSFDEVEGMCWTVPDVANVVAQYDFTVDQDELVAPYVEGCTFAGEYENGKKFSVPCDVDFQNGDIIFQDEHILGGVKYAYVAARGNEFEVAIPYLGNRWQLRKME